MTFRSLAWSLESSKLSCLPKFMGCITPASIQIQSSGALRQPTYSSPPFSSPGLSLLFLFTSISRTVYKVLMRFLLAMNDMVLFPCSKFANASIRFSYIANTLGFDKGLMRFLLGVGEMASVSPLQSSLLLRQPRHQPLWNILPLHVPCLLPASASRTVNYIL
jgi:hypothetical protein